MELSHIRKLLVSECGLDKNRVILVGVSGGPDSLCLMDLLSRLDYPLIIAHFNHNLRPEAREDAVWVEKMTKERGLPFVMGSLDVYDYACQNKLSIEEAARLTRYSFLFQQARLFLASAVAVAHTANDQVETVLMHLLRGSGLAGLKGMAYSSYQQWDQQIPLVRPLLACWREEIMQYCQENHLQPRLDSSNQDNTYYRNRLRNELIPYLQSYNPHVKATIWRMAEAASGELSVIDEATQKAWRMCFLFQEKGILALSLPGLRSLSTGLQRLVVRRAVDSLKPGLRDFDFAATQRAVTFISSPSRSKRLILIAGLQIYLEEDKFYLIDKEGRISGQNWPQLLESVEMLLTIPGSIELGNGWRLEGRLFTLGEEKEAFLEVPLSKQAWLDAAQVEQPLVVRTAHPGERFQPYGMKGHSIKLSDFWINVHLPQRLRAGWPLVCSGSQIIWLPGYRTAHPFRVQESTTRVLNITLTGGAVPAKLP